MSQASKAMNTAKRLKRQLWALRNKAKDAVHSHGTIPDLHCEDSHQEHVRRLRLAFAKIDGAYKNVCRLLRGMR